MSSLESFECYEHLADLIVEDCVENKNGDA
jgi:hypothetical protein